MQILLNILASSVVAGLVSWVASVYLQRLNFKQEYHKQLIAKRLAAYSAVELVVRNLDGKVFSKETGVSRQAHMLFTTRQSLIDFYAVVAVAYSQSVWLSTEVTNTLSRINSTLNTASIDFDLVTKKKRV